MKLTYRPEIDGLRAVAIGAVVLYHAQVTIFNNEEPFKGGFVGVDIFFVISGYLITSIILNEVIHLNTFSFKKFYERRVRRIFPALLFVMLFTIPLAWIYLLPNNFVDFSKSILYSLGFNSNYYFHYSSQEYAAENSLLIPFLHTWSLSVEEQFYILFPVSLLITFKYLKTYLIHILIIGFIISLGLAEWTSRNYSSVSFYFLHTRVWELLAGSILAYFEVTKGCRSTNNILNLILPKIGFLFIILTIVFFKLHFFHPSLFTLIPVGGTCLIIWFSQKDEFITSLLSSKIFVMIGLISYSLYLWHYPIFAFARMSFFFQEGIINKLILGAIIFVLSFFTYYFIEKPARNKNYRYKVIIIILAIAVFILVLLNLSVIKKQGYKNRVPQILLNNLEEQPWNLLKNSNDEYCFNNTNWCKFNSSSKQKIYIVGDSHMAALMYDLKTKLVKKNYQFVTSTFSSCLYYPGFNRIDIKTKKIWNNCNDDYFQKLKKELLTEKNSIIIFGGRFPVDLSNFKFDNEEGGVEGLELDNKYNAIHTYKTIQSSFNNEVLELSKENKIILIYPIPEIGWNPNKKIYNQWVKQNFPKNLSLNYITTSYDVFKKRTKSSFELLDSIRGENIYRVKPHTLFCDTIIKKRCITHDDKNIFYADDDHPSQAGAKLINDLIIKEIIKIRLKSN